MLKTIFAQESKAAALEQWNEVADALRSRHPKLGEMMDASRDDVLATMNFPREHWPQIASTNPLERLNREIKRRSDVTGHLPERRGRRQAGRSPHARGERRMGRHTPIHVPGGPGRRGAD